MKTSELLTIFKKNYDGPNRILTFGQREREKERETDDEEDEESRRP